MLSRAHTHSKPKTNSTGHITERKRSNQRLNATPHWVTAMTSLTTTTTTTTTTTKKGEGGKEVKSKTEHNTYLRKEQVKSKAHHNNDIREKDRSNQRLAHYI